MFEGFDVYTNSGPSGPANGGAFGPLSPIDFRGDTAPEVPFLLQDTLGGAFKGWYAYDGSTHSIYSRYHVYGVRDGDKLWKVQVLGYYGELEGAPVSALYQVRYAEVSKDGLGATMALKDINAWAGGTAAPQSAPSDPKLVYRGDRVLSAFTDHWLDPAASPAAPADAAWLAVAADGVTKHRLLFERFSGVTSTSPGTIDLTVKLVK